MTLCSLRGELRDGLHSECSVLGHGDAGAVLGFEVVLNKALRTSGNGLGNEADLIVSPDNIFLAHERRPPWSLT